MKTPDLTPAQLLAALQAAIAAAIAFGAPITSAQQLALIALAGALATVLIAADAAIRRARAQHLAGPLADQAAASAIREAATASRSSSSAAALAREAAAEAEAQAANEAQPADGIDPATLGD